MTEQVVTITQIAKQLKIDPKVARARLRRAGKDVPATIDKARWSWRKGQAKAVKSLLRR